MNSKAPDAFRTISEVADWLGVNAHVLRFWESKFSQVKPVKRAGGRRYYRRADMELLGGIQKLLHDDGMTIKGVQKVLREQGIRSVSAMSKPINGDSASPAPKDKSTAAPEVEQETAPADAPPEEPTLAAPEQAAPVSDPPDGAEAPLEPVTPPVVSAASAPTESDPVSPTTPLDEQAPSAAPVETADLPELAEMEETLATDDSQEPDDEPEPVADPAPEISASPQEPVEATDTPRPVMPLFTHREPPEEATTEEPEAAQAEPDLEPEIEAAPVTPETARGPIIAPLPGPELTVAEALTRLAPLQVDPALLRPIHARLVALRDRMDAAG